MPKKSRAGNSLFLVPANIKGGAPTNVQNNVELYHVRNETKNNEKKEYKKMEMFIAWIVEYIEYIGLSLLAYIAGKIGLKKTRAQIIAKLKKKNKKLIAKAEKNQKKIETLQKEHEKV